MSLQEAHRAAIPSAELGSVRPAIPAVRRSFWAALVASREAVLLASITLIAALLRFYKLGEWSFWGDELYTIRDALLTLETPGLHPLSFLLTGLALDAWGISEWSARFVSAVVGTLTVPLLYLPLRRMLGSPVALAASLFLALSPWHLYWSQNARFYTTLLLFYSLALFLFYFAIEEDRPLYLVASLGFLGVAFQERLFALFFVPVVVAYLLLLYVAPVEKPRGLRPRNLALFLLPSLAAGIYLAVPYLNDWGGWLQSFGRINNTPFWILAGVIYYVRVPMMVMGGFGLIYLLVQRRREGILLGLAALIPLLAIAVLSLVHYTANRYVFIALSSWTALAGVATVALLRLTAAHGKLLAVGVLAVLLLDPLGENVLYYRYQNGNRNDSRAAVEFIDQHRLAQDAIVSSDPLLTRYYLHEESIDIYSLDTADLATLDKRVWFIADMNVPERRPEIYHWLVHNAHLRATFDVHVQARNFMMRVFLYEPGTEPRPVEIR